MEMNATDRFSTRAADYAQYRPGYPSAVIELLRARCGLCAGVRVADFGSGTGILSAQLLESGAQVMAVEPNAPMRAVAEGRLGGRAGFVSVAGTAEASTLAPHSVALVLAAQAFHWFDPLRTRSEVLRILAAGGWAVLIWNEHPDEPTAFMADYEALLHRYAPEYAQVRALRGDAERMRQFFGHAPESVQFDHRQVFGFKGLKGRLMSSSYAPQPAHALHAPMLEELHALFKRHEHDGKVIFPYRTRVFFARPAEGV